MSCRTTAKYVSKLSSDEQKRHLSGICLHNANSLLEALHFCRQNGIKAFRINSQILPLKTHPQFGYAIEKLPESTKIVKTFKKCGAYGRRYQLRLSFHPDQFILLSSPNPDDFPESWLKLDITLDVEAKAKELAVLKLMQEIDIRQKKLASPL